MQLFSFSTVLTKYSQRLFEKKWCTNMNICYFQPATRRTLVILVAGTPSQYQDRGVICFPFLASSPSQLRSVKTSPTRGSWSTSTRSVLVGSWVTPPPTDVQTVISTYPRVKRERNHPPEAELVLVSSVALRTIAQGRPSDGIESTFYIYNPS